MQQQFNDLAYHVPFASANCFSTGQVKTAKQLTALQMFPRHPDTAEHCSSDRHYIAVPGCRTVAQRCYCDTPSGSNGNSSFFNHYKNYLLTDCDLRWEKYSSDLDPTPKRHLDRFRRFCGAHERNQQTDHATPSVACQQARTACNTA